MGIMGRLGFARARRMSWRRVGPMAVLIWAWTAQAPAQNASGEAELRRVYAEGDAAWTRKDFATFSSYLSPNFKLEAEEGGSGRSYNYGTFLQQVRKVWGNSQATSRQTKLVRVTVNASSTEAVVVAKETTTYSMQRQNIAYNGVSVEHWLKVRGRWMVDDAQSITGSYSGYRGQGGMSAEMAQQWGLRMYDNMMDAHRSFACSMGWGNHCY